MHVIQCNTTHQVITTQYKSTLSNNTTKRIVGQYFDLKHKMQYNPPTTQYKSTLCNNNAKRIVGQYFDLKHKIMPKNNETIAMFRRVIIVLGKIGVDKST
jgi:hypothetical protein